MWLSGLGVGLQSARLPVLVLVKACAWVAHAWVAGQVPSWEHVRDNQWVSVSLLLFLPPSLKIYKKIFF